MVSTWMQGVTFTSAHGRPPALPNSTTISANLPLLLKEQTQAYSTQRISATRCKPKPWALPIEATVRRRFTILVINKPFLNHQTKPYRVTN
jgi:hypothetical protein